jgi:hypothetical protein
VLPAVDICKASKGRAAHKCSREFPIELGGNTNLSIIYQAKRTKAHFFLTLFGRFLVNFENFLVPAAINLLPVNRGAGGFFLDAIL